MKKPVRTMEEVFDSFKRHFPDTEDITLITLKGHLLMEEAVNDILRYHLPRPEHLLSSNVNTATKLKLCRAILPERCDKILTSSEKLNTLRNKLAHHLNYPQLDQMIEDFIRNAEVGSDIKQQHPVHIRLTAAVHRVCAFMFALGNPGSSVYAGLPIKRPKPIIG